MRNEQERETWENYQCLTRGITYTEFILLINLALANAQIDAQIF